MLSAAPSDPGRHERSRGLAVTVSNRDRFIRRQILRSDKPPSFRPAFDCDQRAGSRVSLQINQPTIAAAEPQNKIKASESCVHAVAEELSLEGLENRHSGGGCFCCRCRLVDRHWGTVKNVPATISGNVVWINICRKCLCLLPAMNGYLQTWIWLRLRVRCLLFWSLQAWELARTERLASTKRGIYSFLQINKGLYIHFTPFPHVIMCVFRFLKRETGTDRVYTISTI